MSFENNSKRHALGHRVSGAHANFANGVWPTSYSTQMATGAVTLTSAAIPRRRRRRLWRQRPRQRWNTRGSRRDGVERRRWNTAAPRTYTAVYVPVGNLSFLIILPFLPYSASTRRARARVYVFFTYTRLTATNGYSWFINHWYIGSRSSPPPRHLTTLCGGQADTDDDVQRATEMNNIDQKPKHGG